MRYSVEYKTAIITLAQLFDHHTPDRPGGHCQGCEKRGKYWSCPPFDFDAIDILGDYKYILVIGGKVRAEEGTDLVDAYYASRKVIGSKLIELAHDNRYEVLIAGNCDLCDPCQKVLGNACINPRDMKYSLESLGFLVGSLTKQTLNEEPQWKKSGKSPTHLLNVSGVLVKDLEHLEGIADKLTK